MQTSMDWSKRLKTGRRWWLGCFAGCSLGQTVSAVEITDPLPPWPQTTVELARPRFTLGAMQLPAPAAQDTYGSLEPLRDDHYKWPQDGPVLKGPAGFQLRVGQDAQGVRLLLQLDGTSVDWTRHWLRLRVSTDAKLELPRNGWWGPTRKPLLIDTAADCQRLPAADSADCHTWLHHSEAQRRAVLKLFRQEHTWSAPGGAAPPARTEKAAVLGLRTPMPPPESSPLWPWHHGTDPWSMEWQLPWHSLPLAQHTPLGHLFLGLHRCRTESDCVSLLPTADSGPNDAVKVRFASVRRYRVGGCDLPLLGLHGGQGRWLPAAYYPSDSLQLDQLYTWAAPAPDLRQGVHGLAPSPQLWPWPVQTIPLGADEFLCGPWMAWRRGGQRRLGSVPANAGSLEAGTFCESLPRLLSVKLDLADARGRYWLAMEPPACWFRRYGIGSHAGEPGQRSRLWLLDRQRGRTHLLWQHLSDPGEAMEIRHSADLRRIAVRHWDDGEPQDGGDYCVDPQRLRMRACQPQDPPLPPAEPAPPKPVTDPLPLPASTSTPTHSVGRELPATKAAKTWRNASRSDWLAALELFNAESEPLHLERIQSGIAVLEERVASGEIAWLDLLLGFTEAKVRIERTRLRPDQTFADTAAALAARPEVAELRRKLLTALQQHPDEPRLLRAAINRQLWTTEQQWLQWHERFVALEPAAWDVHLALAKSAAGQGQYDAARLRLITLFEQSLPNPESLWLLLREAGSLFASPASGCPTLGSQLIAASAELTSNSGDPPPVSRFVRMFRAARCAGVD